MTIRIIGVYDKHFNFLDIYADPIQPSFKDEMSGEGAGQFQCQVDDAGLRRTPAILNYENIVVMHETETNKVFPFVIEKRQKTVISQGERADRVWTISGRGGAALFSGAIMYSEYGIRRSSADQRHFSFASIRDASWYISSQWVPPVALRWDQDTTSRRRHPRGWPDARAYWIWSTNPATASSDVLVLFRGSFTLTAAQRVSIFCTADNRFRLYLDGEQVMGGHSYAGFQRFDADLDIGNHVLAIRGINNQGGSEEHAGVLLTCWIADRTTEKLQTLLIHTDVSRWKCRPSDTDMPGWDPGDIMGQLAEEAQARGVQGFDHIFVDVGTNVDSAGNVWPDESRVDRSFNIGDDYLSILDQLGGSACDWRIVWDGSSPPPQIVLKMYDHLGVDRSVRQGSADPVIFRQAFNAVEEAYDGDASSLRTALLIKTQDGWISEVSTTVGADGRKESFLSLGHATDDAQAVRQATRTFLLTAVPQEAITAKSIPMLHHKPFVDFDLGDYVLAPDDKGALTKYRVLAISVECDTAGNTFFSPELGILRHPRIKRLGKWLKRYARGSMGGQVSVASPTSAPIESASFGVSAPYGSYVPADTSLDVPFSYPGSLTPSVSPPYRFRFDSTMVELLVTLGGASTSGNVQIDANKNGVGIASITLTVGQNEGTVSVNESFAADVDVLTMQVTLEGTGTQDLTAQARFN